MAVTDDVTVKELDFPVETAEHIILQRTLEDEHITVIYQLKPDIGTGEVALTTQDNEFRVTHEHNPWDDRVQSTDERESYNNLRGALNQMATWMRVKPETFLDTRSDIDAQ